MDFSFFFFFSSFFFFSRPSVLSRTVKMLILPTRLDPSGCSGSTAVFYLGIDEPDRRLYVPRRLIPPMNLHVKFPTVL